MTNNIRNTENKETTKLLYGVRDVAEMLSISRSSVYGYCATGDLPYLNVGARRLIEKSAVDNFIERAKAATKKPLGSKSTPSKRPSGASELCVGLN